MLHTNGLTYGMEKKGKNLIQQVKSKLWKLLLNEKGSFISFVPKTERMFFTILQLKAKKIQMIDNFLTQRLFKVEQFVSINGRTKLTFFKQKQNVSIMCIIDLER